MLVVIVAVVASVASSEAAAENLSRFLKREQPQTVFPGADRFGPVQGSPPVAAVFKGDEQIGLAYLNSDVVNAVGYSGKPIHVLLAMDMDGVIRSAKLVDHHEPIVLIGIPERKIKAVVDGYIGRSAVAAARGEVIDRSVDIVSGATVTVMVIDDSIMNASIRVARAYGLGGLEPMVQAQAGPKRVVDTSKTEVRDWEDLLGDGSIRRLRLSIQDINQAFEESGDLVAAARPESGDPDEAFIDLYVALASVPTIGRSLLGDAEYRNLQSKLRPGQSAVLVAANGRYSFKGSGYVRGGIFDRFQITQGDNTIRFHDRNHTRIGEVAAEGAPDLPDVDVFRIPKDYDFDPVQPWRIELLVNRATGPTSKAFLTFDLSYRLPEKYLATQAPPAPAEQAAAQETPAETTPSTLWQRLWRDKAWEIGILVAAIGLLTLIFFFQSWLVKRPRLSAWVRIGFLIFTLFGIGFYANAQLSVVNIMTFSNALITGFHWEYFLMDPLIFILWCSVAASLLFWGRGAFCGWLCPFGALQELLNKLAKLARIPQVAVPWGIHERLWPIKYIIFLGLFGFSIYSLAWGERLAEVEPFKTAIILKFIREWPFVLFAGALLFAGLFIERFYCRYLCALGAALAIPGRLRMFEWLKRYRECGSPCQRCANECMVQAIHPEGHINPNECLYCLHCQELYHDDHRCPVMIQRRLKRERRAALASRPGAGPAGRDTGRAKELADFMPR
jgi:NosR/NirI family nitrous oxide reductase transcriptional regulator